MEAQQTNALVCPTICLGATFSNLRITEDGGAQISKAYAGTQVAPQYLTIPSSKNSRRNKTGHIQEGEF